MEVLTYPGLKPIDWHHPPAATTRVSSDLICGDGVRFTGSLRTVCHMAHLMDLSTSKFGAPLHVIQPPYNTSNPSSKGTHDLDACSDVAPPPGVDYPTFQTWLRARGFDCWWRHTGTWASPSAWHIHGFTHPARGPHPWSFATPVGLYVDGGRTTQGRVVTTSQILDYRNHGFGLAGLHTPGSDHSWFPDDPTAVAFDLPAYIQSKQDQTKVPTRLRGVKLEHPRKGSPEYTGDSYRAIARGVARKRNAIDFNGLLTADHTFIAEHYLLPLRHGFTDPEGELTRDTPITEMTDEQVARLVTKDRPPYRINTMEDLTNGATHNGLDVEAELKMRIPLEILQQYHDDIHHPDMTRFKVLAHNQTRSWEWLRPAHKVRPTLLTIHHPGQRIPRSAIAYIDHLRGFTPRWVR